MSKIKILTIVDMQNDYMEGGPMAVKGATKLVPVINDLIKNGEYDAIIATQDWHPSNHISFASTHEKEPFSKIKVIDQDTGDEEILTLWPRHCVARTYGSAIVDGLRKKRDYIYVQKGVDPEISQDKLDEIDEEDWLEVGQRVIKSMSHQVGKISQRELERKMRTKLLTHGFDSGISNVIIDAMDLKEDENAQTEALKKQGIKAYKRFRNLPEIERNFKIKKYLFSHGFSSGEIDASLNGEIIDLDELVEY